MADRLTIACIQMRSGASQAANIDTLEGLVREAAGKGATYVQTPEMTGIVQRDRKKLFAETGPDAGNVVFGAASRLAADLGIWLHIGSTAIALGDGKAANRGALFAPDGSRTASYDKLHMFDVDLGNGESWRESKVYQPGNRAVLADTAQAAIGMGICYDLRFPQFYRALAQAGANLLTAPSCFTRQTGQAHWHTLLRARAIENGAFMVAAAQGGTHEDGRESFGHSLIVDPWGRIIGEIDHDEPAVLTCQIDLDDAKAARTKMPSLRHDREFVVERIMPGAKGPAEREVMDA